MDGMDENGTNFFAARGEFEIGEPIISTTGRMLILFRNNAAVNAQGFMGTYQRGKQASQKTQL